MEEKDFTIESLIKSLPNLVLDPNDFNKTRVIGSGGFARVYEAQMISNGEIIAYKEMSMNSHDKDKISAFCHEIYTLGKYKIPFAPELIGFVPKEPYAIVTTLVPGGELNKRIWRPDLEEEEDNIDDLFDEDLTPEELEMLRQNLQNNKFCPLSPTDKTRIAMCTAYSLAHLHKNNIIHLDLKASNILLQEDNTPCIIDYGNCKYPFEVNKKNTVGSFQWMAPELYSDSCYDKKVDVYAFSLILYEMLTEKQAYDSIPPVKLLKYVCDGKRMEIPDDSPKELRRLINQCWDSDPKKRPNFEEIYLMFSHGEVYFHGTDEVQIVSMAKNLKPI